MFIVYNFGKMFKVFKQQMGAFIGCKTPGKSDGQYFRATSNLKLAEIYKGFSKFSYEDRLNLLKDADVLTKQDITYLKQGGLQDVSLAEKFVENVIGYFQLPLGVATNFNIDGRDYIIPMAVEETSIIAAASKTAKWVRENGSIKTEIIGENIIGQIQFAKVKNFENFEKQVQSQ